MARTQILVHGWVQNKDFGAVSQTYLIRSLVLSVTRATLLLTRCYMELHSANSRTEAQLFVPEKKTGREKMNTF